MNSSVYDGFTQPSWKSKEGCEDRFMISLCVGVLKVQIIFTLQTSFSDRKAGSV